MKTSVIIPTYNGKELLEKNLPFVIQNSNNSEIVIGDDASLDGTLEMLKDKFPRVKVVRSTTNGGFSSIVNKAIKSSSGDLIILLNSDVAPEAGYLDAVLPLFEDPNLFAIGFLQKSIENGNIVLRGRGIGEFKKGFLVHSKGRPDKKDTLWVSGGAGIFNKKIWDKIGGLNDLYNPFYWEDIDMSYRAMKAGYRIGFEPKSVVIHRQAEGSIRTNYSKNVILQYSWRNQFQFVWLNITDLNLLMQHIIQTFLLIINSILSGNWIALKGFFASIKRFPVIMKKRKKLLVLWKKKDKEILIND